MRKKSKKYVEAVSKLEKGKAYTLEEAVKTAYNISKEGDTIL